MRLLLILPQTEELNTALGTCRDQFKKVPWIKVADLDGGADALAQRLTQDDCANGYVVEDFPNTLEELQKLDEQLKDINKKIKLPLALYWSGKAKKEQCDEIKAYRDEHMPLSTYLYANRRLVSVIKPKKLAKGFKEAATRSKNVQLLRRGTTGAFVACLIIALIAILFFRNPFLRDLLVDTAQLKLQAKFDVVEFDTTLSDLGVHIKGVQAADAQEPMKNVFEFQSASASWDLAALSSFKLHAEEIAVEGLQFGTLRKESGALPDVKVEAPAEPAEPAAAEPEDSKFLDALMNTMGDFKPPAVGDLETTKTINKLKADATQSRKSIASKASALDVDKSVAESKAAAANLKQVSFKLAQGNNVQAELDKNKAELATVSAKTTADVAKVKETLKTLKAFKIKDPKKDAKKAKELIESTKSVSDQIKSIKDNIDRGKKIMKASKASVDQAAKDIKAQGEQAKKELQDSLQAVRAPIEKASADISAISNESKRMAQQLKEAKGLVEKAIEQDVTAVKKQYSVDGIKAGSEKLVKALVGESVYNTLETGLGYYNTIKPYLPVSSKKKKKPKRKGQTGTTYEFPLASEEGGMADLWIKKSKLDGQFPVNDDVMQFTGALLDFTSNMAFTNKPVQLKMTGNSPDKSKDLQVDLECNEEQLITGSLSIGGLKMDSMPVKIGGNAAGIAPQSLSGSDIRVQLNDLAIGNDQRDGLIEIEVKNLKVGAPSGKDIHPEIAAVFTETYANLDNITLKLGMGKDKTFRTEPDISQLIASGLNKRVQAKMESAKQKAEAAVRAHGKSQLGELESLAASFDSIKELDDKKAALANATKDIDGLQEKEQKRLLGDEQAALKGLDVFKKDLEDQESSVNEQQSKLDGITSKIEKERKRIQKELLGGNLKDKLKLPF